MRVFLEVRKVRIDPANVPRVLELRRALLVRQADLVRLGDDLWLDVRIHTDDAHVPEPVELRALIGEPLSVERGERVHTTGTAR